MREINIRATLVITNDNVDILVPNVEFINNRVTNWTLCDGFHRIRSGERPIKADAEKTPGGRKAKS